MQAHGRDRDDEQQRDGEHRRGARMRQHAPEQYVPQSAWSAVASALEPLAEPRDSAPLDVVAEQRQRGGEDRQRTEDRDGDDEDGRLGHADERALAGEEHRGHGDDDGEARHEHRAAGRGRRRVDRISRRAAGGALLTRAAEIEQRVVDAHREADEQQHRAGRSVGVECVACDREQAGTRHHGREREHQRQEGGHDGTEDDQEDREGERDGDALGTREVLADCVVERLAGRRRAELLDSQIRVGARDARDLVEHGLDALVRRLGLALQVEQDQRGPAVPAELAAVAGRERRSDPLHPPRRRHAAYHFADRRPAIRREHAARAATLDRAPARRRVG